MDVLPELVTPLRKMMRPLGMFRTAFHGDCFEYETIVAEGLLPRNKKHREDSVKLSSLCFMYTDPHGIPNGDATVRGRRFTLQPRTAVKALRAFPGISRPDRRF
jgi:hypothetical protein